MAGKTKGVGNGGMDGYRVNPAGAADDAWMAGASSLAQQRMQQMYHLDAATGGMGGFSVNQPLASMQGLHRAHMPMQNHGGTQQGMAGMQVAQLANMLFHGAQHPQMTAAAEIQAYGMSAHLQQTAHAAAVSHCVNRPAAGQKTSSSYAAGNGAASQVAEPPTVPPQTAAARLYSNKTLELTDREASLRRGVRSSVVLPSYAAWFDMHRVDDIERRALPEFTASSETCEEYKALRNRIISLYRDIPGRPLVAMDCLRHIAEDPALILRVHAFLDFWGIINTEAQGRVRFQKTLMMLSEPPPRSTSGKARTKGEARGYARCAVSGEPLQRICFALRSDPSYMISATSYMNGMMPQHLSPSDFIRRVNDDKTMQQFPAYDDWTEEETCALLDAIRCVGEDWDMVAQIVKTRSMEQCVLHFARLPIADRYLNDVKPTHVADKMLSTANIASGNVSALAAAAFPPEWAPTWTQWLQKLLAVGSVDAAAIGPASVAAIAAMDGTLQDADVGVNGTGQVHDLGQDDVTEEAYPSADHPWMSVLEWPAPGGVPRMKDLKKDDPVLILSDEAGALRRGRVEKVHSVKAGLVSINLCGDGGVKVFQLNSTQYRVLSSDEVATIERTIGCRFMGHSDGITSTEAPPVESAHSIIKKEEEGTITKASSSTDSPTFSDVEPVSAKRSNGRFMVEDGDRGTGLDGMNVLDEHRKPLWDETGAPTVRCHKDLPALRQAVEAAREIREEERIREAALQVVQAKIAKTAQRLFNAEQADQALCDLRASIRDRQRELLFEKRKSETRAYRPKPQSILSSMMGEEDDEEVKKLMAKYGGGRERLGREAKANRGAIHDGYADDIDFEDD